ncbi:MAG: membrane dipeptidase [Arenicella sp.]|jgi:membrane dipeptidase
MKNLIFLFVTTLVVLPAWSQSVSEVAERANQMAQQMIIVDGHIDVPYRVFDQWEDVSIATESGDFDYPRAKAGGLNAPFMSIYIPASQDDSKQSMQTAHVLIDSIEALVQRSQGKFAIARSPKDIREQHRQNMISLPLGMENGSPIQGELSRLKTFYDRGVRYITLTHAKSNHISDSSYDDDKKWQGLSPFGEQVVGEMNRLGIMVDISHVSDEAFWDALKISKSPMIASHSSARHFTPGFERNMSDKMIQALASADGIIMVNFGSTFLTKNARDWSDAQTLAKQKLEKEMGKDSPELKDFSKRYRAKHPLPFADLSDVLDHIDHIVKIAGIDAVGLGSDYDGVGDSLPNNLKSVADYPKLIEGMIKRGYKESDIEKILGENLLRVWQSVETHSD